MEFIPAKLPLFVQRLFPKYTWTIPTEEQVIYLTFDDGPTPIITPWTLDVLERYQAKATFFCIGQNIETHPDIFHKLLEKGHAVGNHTYSHPKGWKSSTQGYLENVKQAQDIIDLQLRNHAHTKKVCSGNSSISNSTSEISNHQSPFSNLFRPPYGQVTKEQGRKLRTLGYDIIMWTVLAIDWSSKTTKEKALKNVIKHAKSGSIVVFHDSDKASENMQYALPRVLEYFSKKGYSFKAIDTDLAVP